MVVVKTYLTELTGVQTALLLPPVQRDLKFVVAAPPATNPEDPENIRL